MEQNQGEEKRNRWLTRKALQNAIDIKRRQLQQDAKKLKIAHRESKAHPTPLDSTANILGHLQIATSNYEKTLNELANLYAQDRWGDYTDEANLTSEYCTLENVRTVAKAATDRPLDDREDTLSRSSIRSRRTCS